MEVAAVVGHEFLDARVRDLREQITDLLVVAARLERLHDLPMLVPLGQLDLARRAFQNGARRLRGRQVSQSAIAKFIRLFRDVGPDRLGGDVNVLRIGEANIHFPFERGVLAQEDLRRPIRSDQPQPQLRLHETEFVHAPFVRGDFLGGDLVHLCASSRRR